MLYAITCFLSKLNPDYVLKGLFKGSLTRSFTSQNLDLAIVNGFDEGWYNVFTPM